VNNPPGTQHGAEELLLQLHHVPGHVEPRREDLRHVRGGCESVDADRRCRPGAVGHLLQAALHAAGLPAGLATVTELAAVSVPLLAALGAPPPVALLVAEVPLDPLVSGIAVIGSILATRPLLALPIVGIPLDPHVAVIAVVAVAVTHQILLAAQILLS
jgi:hypothetical protein